MKQILSIILVGISLLFTACSDEVRVELDIADAESYVSVYMPQANIVPVVKNVIVSDQVQSFPVSAYYGGPRTPDRDIKITFKPMADLVESYNEEHGTNYLPMPDGSYVLEQNETYIKANTQRSQPIQVNITAKGYLTVPLPYLLPVGIEQVDGEESVVESLKVTYFLITGSYLPGEVPTEKVYSFGHEVTKPVFCRNSDLIRIDENDNLQVHRLKEDETYGNPQQIGSGWGGVDMMFYLADNRFIIRNPWANITQYYINDNYGFLSQRDIGWGWGGAKTIFPFKSSAVIAVNDDRLTKYPVNQNGDWDYGRISDIESSGWGNYKQVFCYENNVIAIESDGEMWTLPFSDDFIAGNKRRIGTGWDMYTKVFQCGEDLLALDQNGDLWRYRFDPNAFWPLKATSAGE